MRNVLYLKELQEKGILTKEEHISAVYSYIMSKHENITVCIAIIIIIETLDKLFMEYENITVFIASIIIIKTLDKLFME